MQHILLIQHNFEVNIIQKLESSNQLSNNLFVLDISE